MSSVLEILNRLKADFVREINSQKNNEWVGEGYQIIE